MINQLIKNKSECNGCYGCYDSCPVNCITMERDKEGFWYPVVDESKCIQCGKCIKACTIGKERTVAKEVSAFAMINNDEAIRMTSSSGGVFTLIANKVLDQGGFIFGAAFDGQFVLNHIKVDNKNDLSKLRASKYVQSKIGTSYIEAEEALKNGQWVLFSGTPCQIGGLKRYLGREYEKLVCIDLICHGVPSPMVWEKYKSCIEGKYKSKLKEFSFRCKSTGWATFSVKGRFENGQEYQNIHYDDPYMRAFIKNISLRPSCHECRFKGVHRESDITLGDFWGLDKVLPELDDGKGTSLLLVQSNKGEKLLGEIKSQITMRETNVEQAIKGNPATVKSYLKHKNRDKFFKNIDKSPFDKVSLKYSVDSFNTRVIRKIKRKISRLISK